MISFGLFYTLCLLASYGMFGAIDPRLRVLRDRLQGLLSSTYECFVEEPGDVLLLQLLPV